jgi:hypothetical protein
MINIEIKEFEDGKKIEIEKNFSFFVKPNLYQQFLIKNQNNIDSLLFFILYSFANIKDFYGLYEKKKDLFKINDKGNIELFLEKEEIENIKNYLKNSDLSYLYEIKKNNNSKTIVLFSLDLVEFSEKIEDEKIEINDLNINKTEKKSAINIPSLNEIINQEILVEIGFDD